MAWGLGIRGVVWHFAGPARKILDGLKDPTHTSVHAAHTYQLKIVVWSTEGLLRRTMQSSAVASSVGMASLAVWAASSAVLLIAGTHQALCPVMHILCFDAHSDHEHEHGLRGPMSTTSLRSQGTNLRSSGQGCMLQCSCLRVKERPSAAATGRCTCSLDANTPVCLVGPDQAGIGATCKLECSPG